MPATLRRSLLLAFVAVALAACSQDKRDGEPRMAADEPEAAEHPTGVRAEEADRAQSTPASTADLPAANPRAPTAFTCDGGNRVEIGDLVAVVTLKDGEGELSQDEGGVFRCHGS
jgi:hypothetical protein